MKARIGWLLGAGLLFAQGAVAQQDDAHVWSWYGDARLRGDVVHDLPGRDDLDRFRSRIRFGAHRMFDNLEFGIALEGALGSDDNRDNRRNNDNERSDAINLDSFYLRWNASDNTSVLLGRAEMPLVLTPLTWDADLRPIGISATHSIAIGDFDRLAFSAGYFAGTHLYQDESRIKAAQIGWFLREGAEVSGDVQLSWLDFSELDQLTANGLTRTNRRVGSHLLSDYRLADLQVGIKLPLMGWPLALRGDVVRNLGADDRNQGARFTAVLGDRLQPMGWEYGLALQRIQRDAVMAAFNEDDWWFHSFSNGQMLWTGYGIDETWSAQLSVFREAREGVATHVKRYILELGARW